MTSVPPPPPPPRSAAAPTVKKVETPVSSGLLARLGKVAVPQAAPAYCWVVIGVEGWGKTSLGAHLPDVLFVSAGNETGYQTLLNAGRAPAVTHAHVDTWPDVLSLASEWADSGQFSFSCWDCGGSLQQLCQEHIAETLFERDREKYAAYGRGLDEVAREWVRFLKLIENAKAKGKNTMLLVHSAVKTFNDPMLLEPYDRYIADLDKRVWSATHRVADEVLFCTFLSDVRKAKGDLKAKGLGGKQRVIHTTRCDAYDAKDRLGLPELIVVPENPASVWPTIESYIGKG